MESTSEVSIELHLDWLLLVVLVALLRHTVHTLLAVEQVRSLIPCLAHCINVERCLPITISDTESALVRTWRTNAGKTDAVLLQECLHFFLMLVSNLDYDTWILCKELLDNIVALDVMEVDMQATFSIGKGHLKQCCDQTSSRDVVSSEYPSTTNHLLYSIEAVAEVLWFFYGWNVTTDLSEALCKG